MALWSRYLCNQSLSQVLTLQNRETNCQGLYYTMVFLKAHVNAFHIMSGLRKNLTKAAIRKFWLESKTIKQDVWNIFLSNQKTIKYLWRCLWWKLMKICVDSSWNCLRGKGQGFKTLCNKSMWLWSRTWDSILK